MVGESKNRIKLWWSDKEPVHLRKNYNPRKWKILELKPHILLLSD